MRRAKERRTKSKRKRWTRWCVAIILALHRPRQENCCKFKPNQRAIVRPCIKQRKTNNSHNPLPEIKSERAEKTIVYRRKGVCRSRQGRWEAGGKEESNIKV